MQREREVPAVGHIEAVLDTADRDHLFVTEDDIARAWDRLVAAHEGMAEGAACAQGDITHDFADMGPQALRVSYSGTGSVDRSHTPL